MNRFCLNDILYKFLTTISRAKSTLFQTPVPDILWTKEVPQEATVLWGLTHSASHVPLTGVSELLGHCRIHKYCHWVIMRHGFSRCFLSLKVFF